MAGKNPLNLQLEANPGVWDIEDKLFNILVEYLPSTSTNTATKTAQEVNALFPSHRPDHDDDDKESAGSFLSEFWDLLFRVACQINPENDSMNRLVGLIKALRSLPPETIKLQPSREAELWSDLPYMSMMLTERYNGIDLNDLKSYDINFKKWKNANGLVALLTNEGMGGGQFRALQCLQRGLESNARKPDAIKATVQCHLPVAVLWLTICSSKLWSYCEIQAMEQEDTEKTLWKGKPGYSKDRWAFWALRLVSLKTHEYCEDDIKRSIDMAISAMETHDPGS